MTFNALSAGKSLLFTALLALMGLPGCVSPASDLVAAGRVLPQEFRVTLPFETHRNTVLLQASAAGAEGTYLFDTAATLSVLHGLRLTGERVALEAAHGGELSVEVAPIPHVLVAAVDFQDSYAAAGNLAPFARVIPRFRGLLGQSVLTKGNWLIDYEQRLLTLRSDATPPSGMTPVPVHYRGGIPHVVLEINGRTVEAQLDSGASAHLSLPRGFGVAMELEATLPFERRQRQVLRVDGVEQGWQLEGTLPQLGVGGELRQAVPVVLKDGGRARLGAGFLAREGRVFLQGGGDLWIPSQERAP